MKTYFFVFVAFLAFAVNAQEAPQTDAQTGSGPLLKVSELGLQVYNAYLPIAVSNPLAKTDLSAVAREGLATLVDLARSADEDIERDLKEFLKSGNRITEVTQQATKPGQHRMTYTIRQAVQVVVEKKKQESLIGGAQLQVLVDTSKDEGPSYETKVVRLRSLE